MDGLLAFIKDFIAFIFRMLFALISPSMAKSVSLGKDKDSSND